MLRELDADEEKQVNDLIYIKQSVIHSARLLRLPCFSEQVKTFSSHLNFNCNLVNGHF